MPDSLSHPGTAPIITASDQQQAAIQDGKKQTLIADHLRPALRQLEGEIADLNVARASSDKKAAAGAEKQYGVSKRLLDELTEFIAAVAECAERGAPVTEAKLRKSDHREQPNRRIVNTQIAAS